MFIMFIIIMFIIIITIIIMFKYRNNYYCKKNKKSHGILFFIGNISLTINLLLLLIN